VCLGGGEVVHNLNCEGSVHFLQIKAPYNFPGSIKFISIIWLHYACHLHMSVPHCQNKSVVVASVSLICRKCGRCNRISNWFYISTPFCQLVLLIVRQHTVFLIYICSLFFFLSSSLCLLSSIPHTFYCLLFLTGFIILHFSHFLSPSTPHTFSASIPHIFYYPPFLTHF
jgi:hypothetical protein